MSDSNDDHIRVNIRPIFMSTLGTWDSDNRIYTKSLPSVEFDECSRTCDALFSIENQDSSVASNVSDKKLIDDNKICNRFCRQLASQYVDDSEALRIAKKICHSTTSTPDINCLQSKRSEIDKEIDKQCGNDEVCLINNKDIFTIMQTGLQANNSTIQQPAGRNRRRKFRSDFKKYGKSSHIRGLYDTNILIMLLVVVVVVSIAVLSK